MSSGATCCRWASPGSTLGGSSLIRSSEPASKKQKRERNMRAGKIFMTITLASVMAGGGIATAADPDAATPEEVVSKVWAASRFLNEKGASGFADFNSKDGRWAWKDSYVFVYDCRLDRMVAHPMRPDLVGRPLMQITDNNGKFIFKELCMAGNDPRGGWVEYVWTKPGAGSVSRN